MDETVFSLQFFDFADPKANSIIVQKDDHNIKHNNDNELSTGEQRQKAASQIL